MLDGTITIDTAQAGNLGLIDLTAANAGVTLATAGTGVFGPVTVGSGEILTISSSAAGAVNVSFASGTIRYGHCRVQRQQRRTTALPAPTGQTPSTAMAVTTRSTAAGNDTINGERESAIRTGGDGNDIIRTGTGSNVDTDNVDAGLGNDEIRIQNGTLNGTINAGADNDQITRETNAFNGGIDGGRAATR